MSTIVDLVTMNDHTHKQSIASLAKQVPQLEWTEEWVKRSEWMMAKVVANVHHLLAKMIIQLSLNCTPFGCVRESGYITANGLWCSSILQYDLCACQQPTTLGSHQ